MGGICKGMTAAGNGPLPSVFNFMHPAQMRSRGWYSQYGGY